MSLSRATHFGLALFCALVSLQRDADRPSRMVAALASSALLVWALTDA